MSQLPLIAKLQWGVCYGLGFGAGLGIAFYLCQDRARTLLSPLSRQQPTHSVRL